jgi:hypothetical protein
MTATASEKKSPRSLTILARAVSVGFHPLLVLTYMLLMQLVVNPYQFGVSSMAAQWKFVLLVFLSTFGMPALAVVLMRALGMVASMELSTRHERIGPYLIAGVFYLWMYINFRQNGTIPQAFTTATLGATIALFVLFFLNNFTKVSAHAAAMGGWTAMAVINARHFRFETFLVDVGAWGALEVSTNGVVLLLVLLTGLVCTARLYLSAHTDRQVYIGLATGFLSQFLALAFS